MKMLATSAVLVALLVSPALAQSYDPSVGSGNIAPPTGYNPNADQVSAYGRAVGGTAQRHPGHAAYGAATPFGTPGVGETNARRAGATGRDAALRECSALARRYPDQSYGGNTGSFQFRACMTEHGQAE